MTWSTPPFWHYSSTSDHFDIRKFLKPPHPDDPMAAPLAEVYGQIELLRSLNGGLMSRLISYLRAALLIGIGIVICGSHLGCNTVHGAGRDVENAGEGIQDAADNAR
jgi:predicted small secreted protein